MILRSLYLTICFYWSFFLTLLVLLAPLEVSNDSFFIGLLSSWVIFVITGLGYLSNGVKKVSLDNIPPNPEKGYNGVPMMFVVISSSFFLSQYAMYFYTGQTVISVIDSLISHKSLYALYQSYFVEKNLMVLSLTKVPAIVSLILLKLTVLWTFYSYLYLPIQIKFKHYIAFLFVCLSYLSFSIARGTNFEVFELLFLSVVVILFRVKFKNMNISMKFVFGILALFVIVLNWYVFTVSARFGSAGIYMCSSSSICLDTGSLIYQISPSLGMFLYLLSGYFSFGLLYISTLVAFFLNDQGWMSLLSFFPFGFSLQGEDITRAAICDVYLDCGASWTPSIVRWMSSLGLLLLFPLLFLIGYLAKLIEEWHTGDFLSFMMLFYMILLTVSLVVGDFVFISSSNTVLFIIGLVVLSFKKINWRLG